MITASGTVTSTESNYVMPSYTGEILECHMVRVMGMEASKANKARIKYSVLK